MTRLGGMGKLYRWFWEDLLQRKEPFTHQFKRMAKAHPLVFWGSIGSVMVGVLGGGIWFILHIIGIC